MKNKRGNVAVIAVIIVIVAITTGVITWLVATKTQAPVRQAVVTQPAPAAKTQPEKNSTPTSEIVSSKTYTSTNLGLTFQFPKEWSVDNNDNGRIVLNGVENTDSNTEKKYTDSDASILISVVENPANLSLQKFFDNEYEKCLALAKKGQWPGGCMGAENVSTWKNITIDGNSALRSGIRLLPPGVPSDDVYINIQGKYIVLNGSALAENEQKMRSALDEVISTLKFTK